MIKFKTDVMELLKKSGYSTYRLRKERLLSESTLTVIRRGDVPTIETLDAICQITGSQIGDLVESVPEKKFEKK